jgi:hypothetical protein
VQILCTHVLLFFRFRSREIAFGGRRMPSFLHSGLAVTLRVVESGLRFACRGTHGAWLRAKPELRCFQLVRSVRPKTAAHLSKSLWIF